MSGVPQIATVATALGCGLVAGTFFGFSTFIMPALDRLAPGQSISAMQSINKVVLSPWFMTALLATAVLCAGPIVWAARSWDRPEAKWLVAGGALYLLGTVVVTMAANVSLNDTLDTVRAHGRLSGGGSPGPPSSQRTWSTVWSTPARRPGTTAVTGTPWASIRRTRSRRSHLGARAGRTETSTSS